MTLSKETLEAASPAAKASAPATVAPPKAPDLNRLRADAVSLDVPVRVHGSRVTEVVRGVTPHTEPFEEETSTMIVFPQGGVVRMNTGVSVGQMLVLTNQKTKQDAICRVVKVRANSNTQSYVEVEFTHRQAGYWGVHFPADDEDTLSLAGAESPVATVSMKVEPLPKPPAPAPKNTSAFTSIGTQEEVQTTASSTDLKRGPVPQPPPIAPPPPPPVRAAAPVAHVAPPAPVKVTPPPVRVAPPPPPEPVEEELVAVEDPIAAEVEEAASQPARTFGTFTGGAGATPARSTDFGARLGADSSVSTPAAPRSNSWMWMAACAFFLVAGLAGGAFYFRQHPSTPPQQASSPTASNSEQPVQQQSASAVQSTQPVSNSVAAPPTAAPAEPVVDRPSRTPAQSLVQSSAQESAPAQPRGAASPSVREAQPTAAAPAQNFAASNPRPIAQRTARSLDAAAPTVTGGPAESASVPDVLSSPSSAAPPPPAPPVRIGGQIVQPKLLRSTPPTYPTAARQAGISGNVVIEAQVDHAGNVGTMKVLSGPATLQAAAVSAMKNWKYSPGTLNGTPIDTQVTVTIHFQQQ